MHGRYIEPRKMMWAVAEITWEDDGGTSFRAPAILEDSSKSGACVRIKRPPAVGSRITVRWHRGQFPAIARNCRSDGREFLLGVRRQTETVPSTKPASGTRHGTNPKLDCFGRSPAHSRRASRTKPPSGWHLC